MGCYTTLFLYIFIFISILLTALTIGLLIISFSSKCSNVKCERSYNNNCNNNNVSFDYNKNYTLKTLDNKYIQSCIGCVGGLSECFDGGLNAVRDNWNGDTVKIDTNSIVMNVKSNNQKLIMKTITNPKSSNNIVCLSSTKIKDCTTNLRLIIYSDNAMSGEKLYRIKSNNDTFVGVVEGVSGNHILVDGFKEPTCNSIFKLE
jgi:hypothetical protein